MDDLASKRQKQPMAERFEREKRKTCATKKRTATTFGQNSSIKELIAAKINFQLLYG